MQSAALLAVSGKSRQDFGYIEHEARSLDFSIVKDLLFKGDHHGSVLYVVRNAMRADSYTQLLNAFDQQLAIRGSTRENDGFVKTHQIGATQFSKSGSEYSRSILESSTITLGMFDLVDEDVIEDCFLTRSLEQLFLKEGMHFGPARYKNSWAAFATMRRWLDNGRMALLPHEDKAQLKFAYKDDFEIKNVDIVLAYNACLERSGLGGELKVWNLEPDESLRNDLGVSDTGYPYPLEMLESVSCISVKLNPGDVYFLNANNLHGVTSMVNGQRLTAGRFLGATSGSKVIYWT